MLPVTENLYNIIDYAHDFALEDPAYIPDRNERWITILGEIIAKHDNKTNLNLSLLCGCCHLPDFFARLISKGFEVFLVKKFELEPIDPNLVSYFHGYQLVKKVYTNLKDEILGTSLGGEMNWLRNIAKQRYMASCSETALVPYIGEPKNRTRSIQ